MYTHTYIRLTHESYYLPAQNSKIVEKFQWGIAKCRRKAREIFIRWTNQFRDSWIIGYFSREGKFRDYLWGVSSREFRWKENGIKNESTGKIDWPITNTETLSDSSVDRDRHESSFVFSALVPGKSMDKIAMAGIDVCRARGVFPGCIILGGEFAGGLMPFQPVAPRVLRLPSPAMFHNRPWGSERGEPFAEFVS